MTGPAWLAGCFAAIMALTAVTCAIRLAVARHRGRITELDADSLHMVMGTAMTWMLIPRLGPVPGRTWLGAFALAAAWFGQQAIRRHRGKLGTGTLCPWPLPHFVECIAMIYMLIPAASAQAAHSASADMPGMSGPGVSSSWPGLALILAIYILGYAVWTADRLARLSRSDAAGLVPSDTAGRPLRSTSTLTAARPGKSAQALITRESAVSQSSQLPGPQMLAPRLAACYKIAMSITMVYMLVLMA